MKENAVRQYRVKEVHPSQLSDHFKGQERVVLLTIRGNNPFERHFSRAEAQQLLEGVRTVKMFVYFSGLNRGAGKPVVKKFIKLFGIEDPDLIADIYGFLGI